MRKKESFDDVLNMSNHSSDTSELMQIDLSGFQALLDTLGGLAKEGELDLKVDLL